MSNHPVLSEAAKPLPFSRIPAYTFASAVNRETAQNVKTDRRKHERTF
jgi:hypothetical protein